MVSEIMLIMFLMIFYITLADIDYNDVYIKVSFLKNDIWTYNEI